MCTIICHALKILTALIFLIAINSLMHYVCVHSTSLLMMLLLYRLISFCSRTNSGSSAMATIQRYTSSIHDGWKFCSRCQLRYSRTGSPLSVLFAQSTAKVFAYSCMGDGQAGMKWVAGYYDLIHHSNDPRYTYTFR